MSKIRFILFVCAMIFITSFSTPVTNTAPAFKSSCNGSISIQGSTNVNTFVLKSTLAVINIDRLNSDIDSVTLKTKRYWINIPAKSFQADHQQMVRDFLTLVKANTHPYISVGIRYSDLYSILDTKKGGGLTVKISIAGVVNDYYLDCLVSTCENNVLRIAGTQRMKLTDFKISPPEKYFGLMRVNNNFLVNFGFVISAS